jgi:hypothetical protein
LGLPVLAGDVPYRFSGVFGPEDNLKAMVEFPDGRSRIVGRGDVLEGAYVTEVRADVVRLRFSSGDQMVRITRSTLQEPSGNDGEALGNGMAFDAQSFEERLSETLKELSGGETETNRAIVNRALRLPAGARIISVDGTTVSSPATAFAMARGALGSIGQVSLAVEGAGDTDEVQILVLDDKVYVLLVDHGVQLPMDAG